MQTKNGMMMKIGLSRLFVFIVIVAFNFAFCNETRSEDLGFFIPIEEETYAFYDYLITSGRLDVQHVLNQPYRTGEMHYTRGRDSSGYFARYWNQIFRGERTNFYLLSQEGAVYDGGLLHRPRADGGIVFHNDFVTFANRFTYNHEYKYDPHFAGYLGDADHWIFGRFNDAYLDINGERFSFFLGRTSRNWGTLADKSLILSDNPYSYDHFLFTLKLKMIHWSMLFAQLDTREGKMPGEQEDSEITVKEARRYLVGQRWSIRLSRRLQIALTQTATYGGENSPIQWELFNPMNIYFMVQHNERKENDGFWALDCFFKPTDKSALWAQFLLDDFVVSNDPGEEGRSKRPDRLGLLISYRVADQLLPMTQLSLTYVRIWNRTYQSWLSWQNYHYKEYGLGYPAASLEEFKMRLNIWRFFPLYLSNELIYGCYGSVSLTDRFDNSKEPFPVPPVIYNWINNLSVRYYISTRFRLIADFHYRRNPQHYSNRFAYRHTCTFKIGLSYLFNFSLPLH